MKASFYLLLLPGATGLVSHRHRLAHRPRASALTSLGVGAASSFQVDAKPSTEESDRIIVESIMSEIKLPLGSSAQDESEQTSEQVDAKPAAGSADRRGFLGGGSGAAAGIAALILSRAAGTEAASAAGGTLETIEFRGMDSGDENKDLPSFTTLPSGVRYIDVVVGKGEEATAGRSASLQWVLRRQNGYFVDASSEHNFDPFIYRVGDTKRALPGFDQGVTGMRVGGKRRFTVPAALAYQATGDDKPGPMPSGFGPRRQIETRKDRETWYFEVELTKLR